MDSRIKAKSGVLGVSPMSNFSRQGWYDAGLILAVYSSGSIAAQKLLFKNTSMGDFTSLFSMYFDTTTGNKKESESYLKIADKLSVLPQ